MPHASRTPHTLAPQAVYDGYRRSFDSLRAIPLVRSHKDNSKFCAELRRHLDEHAVMLDRLAAGLRECRRRQLVGAFLHLDDFFDTMLRSRISRRVMAEQHLSLSAHRPGYVGIVAADLPVAEAVGLAAQMATQMCVETFGVSPEFEMCGDVRASLSYIPAHLDYMLFELFKNAARAVVETHRARSGPRARLPPVSVRVCDGGPGHLTVHVSDQGGGVPPGLLRHVWSYGFSTVGMADSELAQWLRAPGEGASVAARASGQPPADGAGGAAHEEALLRLPAIGAVSAPPWDALDRDNGVGLGNGGSGGAADGGGGEGGEEAASSYVPGDSPHSSAGGTRDALGALQGGDGGGGGVPPSGQLSGSFRMAGLGFGLPLSRLYARYFGGDIVLHVVPGYGTDVYLTLTRPRLEPGEVYPRSGNVA